MTYDTKYIPVKISVNGNMESGIEFSSIEDAKEYLVSMLNRGIPYLSAYIDEINQENMFDPEFKLGNVPQRFLIKTHRYIIDSLKEI